MRKGRMSECKKNIPIVKEQKKNPSTYLASYNGWEFYKMLSKLKEENKAKCTRFLAILTTWTSGFKYLKGLE